MSIWNLAWGRVEDGEFGTKQRRRCEAACRDGSGIDLLRWNGKEAISLQDRWISECYNLHQRVYVFPTRKRMALKTLRVGYKGVRANNGGINREVTRRWSGDVGGGSAKTLNRLCQKSRSRGKIRNTSTPVNPQGRRRGGEQGKFAP